MKGRSASEQRNRELEAENRELRTENAELKATLSAVGARLASTGMIIPEQDAIYRRGISDGAREEYEIARRVLIEWGIPVIATLGKFDVLLGSINCAIVAGGHGKQLEAALEGMNKLITAECDELHALMERAPKSIPQDALDDTLALIRRAFEYRSGVIACVMDHDGGDTLRRLVHEYGDTATQALIQRVIDRLAASGRKTDPITTYCGENLDRIRKETGRKLAACVPHLRKELETKRANRTISETEREVLIELETGTPVDTFKSRYYRWHREQKVSK